MSTDYNKFQVTIILNDAGSNTGTHMFDTNVYETNNQYYTNYKLQSSEGRLAVENATCIHI